MNNLEKLIELTTKKNKLQEEISEIDLLSATKKDEYRKVINEIRKIDKNYLTCKGVH